MYDLWDCLQCKAAFLEKKTAKILTKNFMILNEIIVNLKDVPKLVVSYRIFYRKLSKKDDK